MPHTMRHTLLKRNYLIRLFSLVVSQAVAQSAGMFQLDSGGGSYAHETTAAGARVQVGAEFQDHVVAAWNDHRENAVSHLGVAFTENGFVNFTEATNVIKPNVQGHPSVSEFDSMAASDPLSGDLYVGAAWRTTTATDAGLFIARKRTTDLDFQPAVSVIRNPVDGTHFPANDCHTPAMAIGPRPDQPTESRVYITYLQAGSAPGLPAGYKITWSDDHGQSWTFPADFPTFVGMGRAVPRVGPAGELYVCMHDELNGHIRLGRSFDGGVVWQVTPTFVASIADHWSYADFQVPWLRLPGGDNSAYRVPQWPSIAVSHITGHILLRVL